MTFRYLLLLVLAWSNLIIFYSILTPATVYPVYWFLADWYNAQLLVSDTISIFGLDIIQGTTTIFFKGYYARIIPACIAGAAYYFLLILNLSTPMHLKKRIKSILFLFFSFLLLNIIRILVFSKIIDIGYASFDITHELVWYLGSTVIVIALWFTNVWLFKIRGIPLYTDLKNILEDISPKRNK